MSKKIIIMLIGTTFMLSACANNKTINGKIIEPYGIFNTEDKREGVHYHVSIVNVVLSMAFLNTVVVPVVLCGWYLWEPDGIDSPRTLKTYN